MGNNQENLRCLVRAMYAVQDSSVLDEYGSRIFERPVRGTWKLFRYIARNAVAGIWQWSSEKEEASYPSEIDIPTFEEFATFMLHEVAHGWCYFLKENPLLWNYPTGADEELVCWEVSKLICGMLGISYQEKPAGLCYQFYLFAQAQDIRGLRRILKKLPSHSFDRV